MKESSDNHPTGGRNHPIGTAVRVRGDRLRFIRPAGTNIRRGPALGPTENWLAKLELAEDVCFLLLRHSQRAQLRTSKTWTRGDEFSTRVDLLALRSAPIDLRLLGQVEEPRSGGRAAAG